MSINDEFVVEEMPLKSLRPVIAAWTNEEVKENYFDLQVEMDLNKIKVENKVLTRLYERENSIEDLLE